MISERLIPERSVHGVHIEYSSYPSPLFSFSSMFQSLWLSHIPLTALVISTNVLLPSEGLKLVNMFCLLQSLANLGWKRPITRYSSCVIDD